MPNLSSAKWKIEISQFSRQTINPHRLMVETSKVIPNPSKTVITLQLGDPTIGNFSHPPEAVQAIKKALKNDNFSYYPTNGVKEARQAVSDYVYKNDGTKVEADDVIITSGGSSALELCFFVLANPGENILIPTPSFNYKTWLHGPGIASKTYKLDPTKKWEIDLADLESQIDANSKAILVNNVGNPCGNSLSKENILGLIAIAERHHLPIISDDIYEHFVFSGVEYHSVASLSQNVPVLSCSGLTKRFIMPGIRLGWIIIHDRNDAFREVRKGFTQLLGRNFGPNCSIQKALPDILRNTPQSFFDKTVSRVQELALTAYNSVKNIKGLVPIEPNGAFYMMVKVELENFPDFKNDIEFVEAMIEEQSVKAFPGPCFDYPGYFRFVLTIPMELLIEACDRIDEFCRAHYLQKDFEIIDY